MLQQEENGGRVQEGRVAGGTWCDTVSLPILHRLMPGDGTGAANCR